MPVCSEEVERVLLAAGWTIRAAKGSHSFAISPDGRKRATIPRRRELAAGTLSAIERQTGLKFRIGSRRI